jgi:transposase
MVTQKLGARQLAREFDRDDKWVRKQLRKKYGHHPVGKRWEWNERQAQEVREWMSKLLNAEPRRS